MYQYQELTPFPQDEDLKALWPKNTGTRVYQLMKVLLGEPTQKKR